jgi:hypothetical protein
MTDLERLIGLARIARAAFERVAAENGYRDHLGGLCYDASSFLRRMALAYGIKTDLGQAHGHWFVLFGDVVVDITSTQFGHPDKVAVLSLSVAQSLGSWWQLLGRHSDLPPRPDRLAELAEKEAEDLMGMAVGEAEL